jgi:hypothetical protein
MRIVKSGASLFMAGGKDDRFCAKVNIGFHFRSGRQFFEWDVGNAESRVSGLTVIS